MSEDELRNELQQISNTLQQFDDYSKQLQIQLETLRNYLLDLARSRSTLENLKQEKNPEETLFQLGSGIMLKAKPIESDKVFYNVGAGVVISRSLDEAIKHLDLRMTEVETESQALGDQLSQIGNQMGMLERRGQEIISKLQGPTKAQYDPSLVS
ncbi:MAG: prefoldin subunit alpha [Candidatus Heimdallarchaeota archaeon]|nr:prefoldin subunit alpha [Candidatus Heimdallarchaeota archaeon]